MENFIVLCVCSFIFFIVRASSSSDSITPSQSIRDGETLVSAGGIFELGFFSPGNSKNRYVGVWYKNISPLTVVWVANRGIPVRDGSGVLKFTDHGVLLLLNATNSSVWSSSKSKAAENPIAQLLDSGNLVVKNGPDTNEENLLWQSFDHPCDTFLPGMKLGWNLVTGLDRFISSWKNVDDPSEGDHMLKIDLRGYPQVVQTKGPVIRARAGSWNGNGFTGYPLQKPNPVLGFYFVMNEKEVYYEYQVWNRSMLTRYVLNSFGIGQRFTWMSQTSSWETVSTSLSDQCENYAVCGGYSICTISTTPCECLKGFVPKNPEQWNISYWSDGCVLRTKLDCTCNGFQRYGGMKLPDTSSSWYSKTMSLDECRKSCLENCSCTAYANLDIRDGGSGCLLWFDNLIDMKQFPQGGQDLYIRLPASELDHVADNGRKFSKKKLLVGVAAGFVILVMGLTILGLTKDSWKKKLKSTVMAKINDKKQHNDKQGQEDIDLPTFDLSIISQATNNFSSVNKLGEGGYGPVYKGTLADGQELAVKRLSLSSGQGLEEFKNEVALIAKLQHRNLVRLLGCCIQQDEKLLIYEYMPNKSLDYFIFDQTRSKLVDWFNRYHIISGIARGLLYLHQDSRLRIIHRDLKTSNILLDVNMNPKISDFGLARTFGGDQVEANTNRVVGTYGYMSPEYAVHGHFSVKSDVFSFGVIVLEIVSGRKNRGFSETKHYLNLLGHAWRLWNEERPLELIDELLSERCAPSQVVRCIQVGLLCVQQKPEDRPDMASVVLMLNGEKSLPNPKLPAFYTEGDILEVDSSSSNYNPFSQNGLSLTVLEAR